MTDPNGWRQGVSTPTLGDVYALLGMKVCGICSGTGTVRSYGFVRKPLTCHFCDGRGTMPLAPPAQEVR